jgi:hypothetical protein
MREPSGGQRKRRTRGLRTVAALGATALVPTMLSTAPAEGTVTDTPGVAAGHNITVFHNIDFVAVTGYEDTDLLTVRVLRNGAQIGTATGDARGDAVEGFGLEVNHGPEEAPLAGDCWEGNVPNIKPRDHIQVLTNGTLTDEVIVDKIKFTPAGPRELGNGDIVVPFAAFRANGNPIPAGFIDSPEFRAAANAQVRFEAGPGVKVERRPSALPGQLRVRYTKPFKPVRNRPGWNQKQLRRALLGDGHAIGFGHVAVLPAEGMLVDGLTDTPGPALGC